MAKTVGIREFKTPGRENLKNQWTPIVAFTQECLPILSVAGSNSHRRLLVGNRKTRKAFEGDLGRLKHFLVIRRLKS